MYEYLYGVLNRFILSRVVKQIRNMAVILNKLLRNKISINCNYARLKKGWKNILLNIQKILIC